MPNANGSQLTYSFKLIFRDSAQAHGFDLNWAGLVPVICLWARHRYRPSWSQAIFERMGPFSANTKHCRSRLHPDNHEQHATISQGRWTPSRLKSFSSATTDKESSAFFRVTLGYIGRSWPWVGLLCEFISQIHIPSNPNVILLDL